MDSQENILQPENIEVAGEATLPAEETNQGTSAPEVSTVAEELPAKEEQPAAEETPASSFIHLTPEEPEESADGK